MAITFNGTNALKRLTNVVGGSSDYSCVFWVKFNATPSSGTYGVPFVSKAADNSEFCRVVTGVSNLDVQGSAQSAVDGEGATSARTFTSGAWYCVAYVRYAAFDTQVWYIQGSGVGNLFFTPPATLEEVWLGSDGAMFTQCSIAYFREWDKAIELTELKAELRAPSAVDTVNLVTDTPLTSDVLDVSGNGNDWTLVGTGHTFEADPTQQVLSHIEMAIGATIRTSSVRVPNPGSVTTQDGSHGLQVFGIADGAARTIAVLTYGSTQSPGNSSTFTGGIYTAIYANMCLAYFTGGTSYARPTAEFPYADPQLGKDGNDPRINWPMRIWKMRLRTSTFDFLVGDPTNPFSSGYAADGEIEVVIDGVTVFAVSGVSIKRCKINYFSSNTLNINVYPCGDMDSVWVSCANAFPTISGAENTPVSDDLRVFTDFNDGTAPGWTDTKLAATSLNGVIFNPTAGLNGTIAASTNDGDIATSASLSGVAPHATPYGALHLVVNLDDVPASLTITKATIPSDATAFSFAVSGDAALSPDTFTLADGESRRFSPVTPGTYALVETLPTGYVQSAVVSNGSPLDAITVAAGEQVSVVVTNRHYFTFPDVDDWPSEPVTPGDAAGLGAGSFTFTPGPTPPTTVEPPGDAGNLTGSNQSWSACD